jgi:hypothetical protein
MPNIKEKTHSFGEWREILRANEISYEEKDN